MDVTRQMWQQRILAEEQKRVESIKERWELYYGDHKEQLKVKPGKANDNITINLSKHIVNMGVDFLFSDTVPFELEEGETTPAEEWLSTVWNLNRQDTLLQRLALMGAVTGHYFLKILPEGKRYQGATYPRIVVLSTDICRKITDPDDVETPVRYIIEYVAVDPDSNEGIAKKQVIERGEVAEGDQEPSSWQLEWWEAKGDEKYRLVNEETWPYSWPPIVDGPNLPNPGEPYGLSDLEDVDLQNAINNVGSKINRIIRYHSSPQTFGTGFRAEELETHVDGIIALPTAGATLENLEMQSDLSAVRGFWADLIEMFHHISRVPRLDPTKVNVGALSGFALRILYGPLLGKTTTKQRLYGDGLIELMRRLLELGDFGSDIYATIHWPDPLPTNPLEETQALGADRDMGLVSKQTARVMRGYDDETEKVRIAEEGTQAATFGERIATAFAQGVGGEGGRIEQGGE